MTQVTTLGALAHCTMRTLESRNSSGLIAPGHISKNHQRYSKERHFFFKLSTRRKIEKIQFPWVSYSKFSILAKYASVSYTQICIWYRAILLEDASDASVPLYKYGSILHTVPPYFPMYALCSGQTFHNCQRSWWPTSRPRPVQLWLFQTEHCISSQWTLTWLATPRILKDPVLWRFSSLK